VGRQFSGSGGTTPPVYLSVVLATYNGGHYLQEQLESIRAQTRRPDELVVGDDGSEDATLQILDRFQRTAPFPVTVARRHRTGIVGNFMLSVGDARGDVLAFSDQDDVWLPEKLERCLAAMHSYDADVVVHGLQPVGADLDPTRAASRNVRRPVVEERLTANVWGQVSGNAMIFRRRVLDGCDWSCLPSSQMAGHPFYHDELVRLLGAVRGRTVRIPERLVLYRQHGDNAAGAGRTLMDGRRTYSGHVASLERRAEVAREWAIYFPPFVSPDERDMAAAYFRRAADTMSARAERLYKPAWRAVPAIGAAVTRRDYSSRRGGGFGWRALLQDLYQYSPGGHSRGRAKGIVRLAVGQARPEKAAGMEELPLAPPSSVATTPAATVPALDKIGTGPRRGQQGEAEPS
jgi:glycosyltransferase involved in cell wall biosynthesis